MKRILYVDIAFWGIKDGGSNRSRFIWESLCRQYEVDWLEIVRDGIPQGQGLPEGLSNHFKLPAEIDRRCFNPVIIYRFRKEAEREFLKILQKNNYSAIFLRFLSPVRLGDTVQYFDSTLPVIVDVDMLLSRLSRLSWEQNRSLSNRYYLFESLKLEHFEKKIFQKPYLYFFTNRLERELVLNKYSPESADNFQVIPNVMNESEQINTGKWQRLLFFGTLTSAANTDALKYLAEEIYPLLEKVLIEHDVYFDVAGRGWKPEFEQIFIGRDRLRHVGEVADIQEEISKSLLVFLPLRIASGTRTRILEVANQAVPVITTPIGVEGLNFNEEEIIIRENPAELVEAVAALLNNANRRQILGQQLRMKSRALYLAVNVSNRMLDLITNHRETANG